MFCPNPDCPGVVRSGPAGEYRAEFTNCSECGATLSAEPPQRNPEFSRETGPDEDLDFVVVGRLDNPASLAVARAMLDEAGIRHFIRNQQSFSPWGGTAGAGVLGPAELAVEPDRADEAEQLLANARDAVPVTEIPRFNEPQASTSLGDQFRNTPSLTRVVFFGAASALFLAAVVIGLLESERINGFWLFLGVLMGLVALDAQRRRRQAYRADRS